MIRKNWFNKEKKQEKDRLEKENAGLKRKIEEMEYEIKIWKEKMKNSNEREVLFQENYRMKNGDRLSSGQLGQTKIVSKRFRSAEGLSF